ncbi:MAG: CAP domain-containing protein [Chthoniobacteraceae bacterium]
MVRRITIITILCMTQPRNLISNTPLCGVSLLTQPRAGIIRRRRPVRARVKSAKWFVWPALLCVVLVALTSEVTGKPEWDERARMAQLLVGDPSQARPKAEMTMDPILTQVAQARAADLARRRYFSHVNPDGHGPNHLVRAAGYELPTFWGTARKDNFIESIGAGYASAGDVWRMWMNSSGHRTHLLGRKSMYQEQTNYGIGYYADPSSPYRCYWVIITAPPEQRAFIGVSSRIASRDPGKGAAFRAGNGVTLREDRATATAGTASSERVDARTKFRIGKVASDEPVTAKKPIGIGNEPSRAVRKVPAARPVFAATRWFIAASVAP